jgi:hypothetical protein
VEFKISFKDLEKIIKKLLTTNYR